MPHTPEHEATGKIRITDGALRSVQRRTEKGRSRFVLAGRLIETRSGLHAPIREESATSEAKE